MNELSLRSSDANPDDLEKASQLRKLFLDEEPDSLRRSCEAEYYRWKLVDNPLREGVIYLADAEGRTVGITTVTPKRISIRGKLMDGGEIGDTFTHPEWQRKGIFTALVNLSREEGIKRRLDLIYGTPNHKSLPGYQRKCDFAAIPSVNLEYLVYPLDPSQLFGAQFKFPLIPSICGWVASVAVRGFSWIRMPKLPEREIAFKSADRFPEDIGEVWQKASKNYDWVLERSKIYLDWRFMRNPDPYRIWVAQEGERTVGYLVQKEGIWRGIRIGYLADFLIAEEKPFIFSGLIAQAVKALRNQKAGLIAAWAVKGGMYHMMLKKCGFLRLRAVPIICYKNDLGKTVIDQRLKWHFTMADSDNI